MPVKSVKVFNSLINNELEMTKEVMFLQIPVDQPL